MSKLSKNSSGKIYLQLYLLKAGHRHYWKPEHDSYPLHRGAGRANRMKEVEEVMKEEVQSGSDRSEAVRRRGQ
tara:strand:+ start:161 stop:379 length:219 start_codon:yes stop_codon:yes gene_type:complete